MKIGDLARRTGLSVDTLRYYEKIGLLPRAARDDGGRRVYDADTLTWVAFLKRLRTTGMPIRDMLRYARLRAEGPATGPDRQALLEEHRAAVRARVAELQSCLTVLDDKIAGYAGALSERTDHDASDTDTAARDDTAGARRAGAGGY
ncbi:MerR family transcriptional regulator [Alloyangia pacifica]|uniref:MerR family transcriptional regulator n=1 Tax=Alloyangia pacifica TaxID=311180 RepID=UPI001CD367E7|nr:MerR family transcriptional regulator [Alloyangia pacifica]MCA0997658.1 MerR family transcriptional regulator [Alloyangia pacifica]